jgi:hypothetical protein
MDSIQHNIRILDCYKRKHLDHPFSTLKLEVQRSRQR